MHRVIDLHAYHPSAPPHWRRLFHIAACSAIPTIAIFASATVMVILMSILLGAALAAELARFMLPGLNSVAVRWLKPLLKETEERRVTGATYIAFSALAAFLLFNGSVAIVALFFLALGDPIAGLVGRRMGGIRVFRKSPWGTLAFFLVSMAIAGALSAGGVVSLQWGIVVGAAVAALVELMPSVIDDNVTIPLISGAAMTLMGVG